MKVASIAEAVKSHNNVGAYPHIEHILVHTGQHYDEKLSKCFFQELGIPEPDINLEVGSGSHAQQTAEIMKRFEPVLLDEQPDVLIVWETSTPLLHVPWLPPRLFILTVIQKMGEFAQSLSMLRQDSDPLTGICLKRSTAYLQMLLVIYFSFTEEDAVKNLTSEGVATEKMVMAGNVMIDTLLRHMSMAKKSDVRRRFKIPSSYALVTMHRPSNVDTREALKPLIECLIEISKSIPLVFPVHPRTRNALERFELLPVLEQNSDILLLEPLPYLDFLNLISSATLVLTDSGGIQEETTALQVPCITMRENTERPVTVTLGTNYLTGTDPATILSAARKILSGQGKKGEIPPYWDGKAGERIVKELVERLSVS